MKNHHILRFLFVRALTAVFHVGGLGVVDKQNNTRWVEILPYVYFCVLTQRGYLSMKTKSTWGNATTDFSTFSTTFLYLLMRGVDTVSCRLHQIVVCGLQMGQEYRNVQLCNYTRYTANPCCVFTFQSPSLIRILKYCKMLGNKCNHFEMLCFAT